MSKKVTIITGRPGYFRGEALIQEQETYIPGHKTQGQQVCNIARCVQQIDGVLTIQYYYVKDNLGTLFAQKKATCQKQNNKNT